MNSEVGEPFFDPGSYKGGAKSGDQKGPNQIDRARVGQTV